MLSSLWFQKNNTINILVKVELAIVFLIVDMESINFFLRLKVEHD